MKSKKNRKLEFFLSEVRSISDKDLALIIEMMRASHHINVARKLFSYLFPPDVEEDETMISHAQNDDVITMLFNMLASQLREALKLFWRFSESQYFQTFYKSAKNKDRATIDQLLKEIRNKDDGNSFLNKILIPVRNLMFHYQTDDDSANVIYWINKIREEEKNGKPHHQTIDFETSYFGPGFEYDSQIFSKYIFFGAEKMFSNTDSLRKLGETQTFFIDSTKIIVADLLKKENIRPREFGWILKYSHGFK